jgi:hypothetical protein
MATLLFTSAALPPARRFLSSGALLALVYGLCQLGFRGWPAPGADVQNWPPWIAFAAGLLTLCARCAHGPILFRTATRLALTGVAGWLLLRPQLAGASAPETAAWIAGVALAWTVLVLLWERAHAAAAPLVSLGALTALAGCSAASLLLFDCMTYAQFAGILTAALGAALVLGWWRPGWLAQAGTAGVVAFVLPTLWLLGHRYADLPLWALPLLALAGLVPWLLAGPLRHLRSWHQLALAVVLTGVAVAPVLAWGIITSLRAAGGADHGY